jgi:hypothetical protein
MLMLGFLGFPPFAFECYVMSVSTQLAATRLRGHFPCVHDIVIRVIIVDPVDLVGLFWFCLATHH